MNKKHLQYAGVILALIVALALGFYGLDPYLCVIVYFSLSYILSLLISRGEPSAEEIGAVYYEARLGDRPGARAKVARFRARLEEHKYATMLLPLAMIALTTYLMRQGLHPALCTLAGISMMLGYFYYLGRNTKI